jgi:hypothetical protein
MAFFGGRRPQPPAPFAHATVENHIPALVRECMLEIEVLVWEAERSEDSTTRETEGGHAEPWAASWRASTLLVDLANTDPHTPAVVRRRGMLDKEEIPRISLGIIPIVVFPAVDQTAVF